MINCLIIIGTALVFGTIGYYYSNYNQKRIGIRFIAKHTNREFKKIYKDLKHLDYEEIYDIYSDCLDVIKEDVNNRISILRKQ